YRMKKVSQGLVRLPGIASPTIERWKASQAAAMKGLAGPPANKNRFWFEPGSFTYKVSYASDTVFLDTAQVVLRDQLQSLSEGRLMVGAWNESDALGRAFAGSGTERREDPSAAEPIWRDMHNMFRHFAVARIIADRNVFRQVGFDSDLLLDHYDPPKADT